MSINFIKIADNGFNRIQLNERVLVLIYLDNAATTKANLDVIDSFVKVNQSLYYNPNSPHYAGLQAAQILQQAKKQVTQIMNCPQFDVLFTSGATESNNIALKGIAYKKRYS